LLLASSVAIVSSLSSHRFVGLLVLLLLSVPERSN
jgi:hypothetical protein